MDTTDPLAPASAHLINITDGDVDVPGSQVLSYAPHTDPVTAATRTRGANMSLSGDKEYRVERGGPAGSGATIHLHEARIIVRH